MAITPSQQNQVVSLHPHKVGQHKDETSAFRSTPKEIFFEILKFLSPAELCSTASVSQRFCLLTSDDCLWAPHLKQYFPYASTLEIGHVKQKYQQHLLKQNRIHSNMQRGICSEEIVDYQNVWARGDLLFSQEEGIVTIAKIDDTLEFKELQTLSLPDQEAVVELEYDGTYLFVTTFKGSLFVYKKDVLGSFTKIHSLSKTDSNGNSLRFFRVYFAENFLFADGPDEIVIWKKDSDDQFTEMKTHIKSEESTYTVLGKFMFILSSVNGTLEIWKRDQQDNFNLCDTLKDVYALNVNENFLCISFSHGQVDDNYVEILQKNDQDQLVLFQRLIPTCPDQTCVTAIKIYRDFLFMAHDTTRLTIWKKGEGGQFEQLQTMKLFSCDPTHGAAKFEYGYGRLFFSDPEFGASVFNFTTSYENVSANIIGHMRANAEHTEQFQEAFDRLNRLADNPSSRKALIQKLLQMAGIFLRQGNR